MGFRLLVGSNNSGKVAELTRLLDGLSLELVTPGTLGLRLGDVPETGSTYRENARLKALAYSSASHLPSIADDSGIELADLGGWPGVHSVRFAGPDADDATRRRLLLERLATLLGATRRARFHCSVAVARNGTVLAEVTGTIDGAIAWEPQGTGGFGYDSLFIPEGEQRTIAELTPTEKDVISHRARAIARLRPLLEALSRGELKAEHLSDH
jgi:XTP/dITP diphosphohydrolase